MPSCPDGTEHPGVDCTGPYERIPRRVSLWEITNFGSQHGRWHAPYGSVRRGECDGRYTSMGVSAILERERPSMGLGDLPRKHETDP